MASPLATIPSSAGLSEVVRHQILLVLLCGVVFLTNLGGTHLWDEDEAHFGSTVMEMMRRGDPVVPYFNGELSLHKPAFMYWVMMVGTKLFGNSEFALRFGSVVFSTGTVLLTYHAARMLFTPNVGFWSGLALATCLQFMVISRAAVSDPELIFFCTLSTVIFIAARHRHQSDANSLSAARGETGLTWTDWALCYAAMGGAVLVKGPVGVVVPTAALGLYLLCEHADLVMRERGRREPSRSWLQQSAAWVAAALSPGTVVRTIWAMRPFTAMLLVAAVAAPWYVWVGLRTNGDWPRGFLLVHNVGRFSRAFENHAGTVLYYPMAAVVGMFPWSIFLYQSLRELLQKFGNGGSQRRAVLFLMAQIAVWLGVFSVSGTKLPHYIAAAYPALAIVAGSFVAGWMNGDVEPSRGWLRVSWASLMLVGITFFVGGGIVLSMFLPNEMHLVWIGSIPLLGGIVGWWACEQNRRSLASAAVVASGVGFLLAIFGWAAPQVSAHQNSPHVARWVQKHATTASPHLRSYQFFLDSLVYYSGDRVERCADAEMVQNFFAGYTADAFLVTTRNSLESLGDALPRDVVELESMPRFLRGGEVVLLGRANGQTGKIAHGNRNVWR